MATGISTELPFSKRSSMVWLSDQNSTGTLTPFLLTLRVIWYRVKRCPFFSVTKALRWRLIVTPVTAKGPVMSFSVGEFPSGEVFHAHDAAGCAWRLCCVYCMAVAEAD